MPIAASEIAMVHAQEALDLARNNNHAEPSGYAWANFSMEYYNSPNGRQWEMHEMIAKLEKKVIELEARVKELESKN